MFVGPDDDPRGIGGVFVHHGDERSVLAGYLHDYRLTLELKCAGLGPEAMARRSVEPSDLSLLGLVRHLSDAERYWFRQVMAGDDAPSRYRASAGDEHDRAFSDAVADQAAVALAWDSWRAEVAFAERFVDEASDLDLTKPYVGRGGHRLAIGCPAGGRGELGRGPRPGRVKRARVGGHRQWALRGGLVGEIGIGHDGVLVNSIDCC